MNILEIGITTYCKRRDTGQLLCINGTDCPCDIFVNTFKIVDVESEQDADTIASISGMKPSFTIRTNQRSAIGYVCEKPFANTLDDSGIDAPLNVIEPGVVLIEIS